MLIEFIVENYGPIRDEAVLSMLTSEESNSRYGIFRECGYEVVNISGIYGANASGKSSVVEALKDLSNLVSYSGITQPRESLPDFRFRFSTENKPTKFTVSFTNEDAFEYILSIFEGKVKTEKLTNLTKETVIFERNGQNIVLGEFDESDRMMSEIIEKTDSNNLFLSRCIQFRINSTMLAGQWLQEKIVWTERDITSVFNQTEILEEIQNDAVEMLSQADLGISDILFSNRVDIRGNREPPRLKHKIISEDAPKDCSLDLTMESEGTITLLSMIPALKSSLDEGKLLIVDELESSLHPLLVDYILGMFMDATNGAQILFTSHDAGIPTRNNLHPDQIWFTSRDPFIGRTFLYPLTDFEIDDKYEFTRDYLEGRMGALPSIPVIWRGGE